VPPAAWYGPHGTALEFSAAPSASQLLWDALLLVALGNLGATQGCEATGGTGGKEKEKTG